jgi:hypothetical protein
LLIDFGYIENFQRKILLPGYNPVCGIDQCLIMIRSLVIWFMLLAGLLLMACKKDASTNNSNGSYKLDYGDSIFYLTNSSSDYIVNPLQQAVGKFYGFPEGIQIDENTGAIDVSKSETGLRYRISFVPSGKTDSISTVIIIAGINFLDGFYKLSGDDSIARPVYNARLANAIPGLNNGSIFDEGSNCNSSGCKVNTMNGQINLAETVRNGVFGTSPSNNARQEFQMNYRINDRSGGAGNSIRVKLYYFDTMADVTQEVYDIISSRDGNIFGLNSLVLPSPSPHLAQTYSLNPSPQITGKTAKPRPPCIFIVAR